jgi:hypothetical protein
LGGVYLSLDWQDFFGMRRRSEEQSSQAHGQMKKKARMLHCSSL